MSVNGQLYWSTSMSTMPVWPLPAASITGVMSICRKHSKSNDQDWKWRDVCMQANHTPTSHQDLVLNDENKLDSCTNMLPQLIAITQWTCLNSAHVLTHLSHAPHIAQPTTGPTALCKTPACPTTHTLVRALGSNLYSSITSCTTSAWPSWAATCSMVNPPLDETWSRDPILGTKYWRVLTWPPDAAQWRAFHPFYKQGNAEYPFEVEENMKGT